MNTLKKQKDGKCVDFRQLSKASALVGLFVTLSPVFSQDTQRIVTTQQISKTPLVVVEVHQKNVQDIYDYQNSALLKGLNPYHKVRTRGPANYIPGDHIEPTPKQERIWLQEIFVKDNDGVLDSIQSDLRKWQEREAYARRWGIESTGLYDTPDMGGKKNYLAKRMLKYVDARLSTEIDEAEEGSTFHKIGKVEKAVKPDTEVDFSDKFKLKMKAKVLQGEAFLNLSNPYFHYETKVGVDGDVDMNFRKDLKDLKVQAAVDYDVDEGYYMARLDRPLSEYVTGRISSTQQDDEAVMADSADKRVEFFYSTSF